MQYKDGVIIQATKIVNGKPITLYAKYNIKKAIIIADRISKEISGKEIIITSFLDGTHGKNSLHYEAQAFDIRVFIYSSQQHKLIFYRLKSELGKNYDVVDEGDHIHIEYDPK